MTQTQPYERIEQYGNGFDIDLAFPNKTDSYRVMFRATTKGGVTDIYTLVNGEYDPKPEIPHNALETIRKYSKLYYNVDF